MKKYFYLLLILVSFLSLNSCKKDTDTPPPIPLEKYEGGLFIINEGNFGHGNGSITYYNPTTNVMTQDVFQLENNRNLGDVVQSMKIIGDLGFIAVNNSNKIEVVEHNTFKEKGVINNIPSVRYIVGGYENTAYASSWGNADDEHGQIKVIDTKTLEVTQSIAVGNGPEAMLFTDNKLFVANGGGLGVDNTLSIINAGTNEVIKTIEVGYSPKQFVKDQDGNIWVLCSGAGSWSSVGVKPSKLIQIDTKSLEITQEVELFADQMPANIGIDKTGLVMVIGGGYGFNGLYKVFVNNPESPQEPFINQSFYGFGIDAKSGDIYAGDAGDYTNNGRIYHFSFLGEAIGDAEVGIIPNGINQ